MTKKKKEEKQDFLAVIKLVSGEEITRWIILSKELKFTTRKNLITKLFKST